MNKFKYFNTIIIYCLGLSLCLFFLSVQAQEKTTDDLGASTLKIKTSPISIPKISVSIPNLTFRDATCTDTDCSVPWIADYIISLYKYGIGIIGILAVITIMIGGVIWLTAAGNNERVSEAKKWIGGSLVGVLIAFTSYLIISLVNPALTELSPIKLAYLKNIPLTFSLSEEEFQIEIKQTLPNVLPNNMPPLVHYNNSWLYKFVYNKLNIIPTVYADNFFDPPPEVKRYAQCSEAVQYKDYSNNGLCEEKKPRGNELFPSGNIKSTLCSSGCGLASLYGVLDAYGASIQNYAAEMQSMARYMEENNYRVCDAGTAWDGLIAYAKSKGLTGEIINNKKTAFKLLDNDYPVIIVVGGGSKCTDGGHFMVLTGKRGDTLYVNDSKSDQAPNFCSTIQTSEPDQKGYIFIHPPGQPNIGQNCITEWAYGCTSNTDCCSGLKCVNHGRGERKCQSCIPLWEYEANGLPCCNGLHYISDQYGNKCAPSS
jgi:hypothetical protein